MRSSGLHITPVVLNLIILNAILFFGVLLIDSKFGGTVESKLCLYQITSASFKPHQLITYAFLHANFAHLFFNMFGLWSFGTMLEMLWGSKRFLIFYIFCVIGGAVLHNGIQYAKIYKINNAVEEFNRDPNVTSYRTVLYQQFGDYATIPENQMEFEKLTKAWENDKKPENQIIYIQRAKNDFYQLTKYESSTPMLGASGGIFGLLLGVGLMMPNTLLSLLLFPIGIKAKYFVIIFGIIELYGGTHKIPGDNVAHFGHLGGMIFGLLLISFWYRKTIFRR